MIILLNGGSSVGKSSIAREIMKQSTLPFIYFSIDHLVNYWIDEKFVSINIENPAEWQKEWFFHAEKKDERGTLVKIQDGPKAKKLHHDLIKCLGYLAKQGYNLLIDEVVWRKEIFSFYLEELTGIENIYLIKVKSDLKIASEREKERKDRFIGLAKGLAESEKNIPCYDLEIDTTNLPPNKGAEIILRFIEKNPSPDAFQSTKK